MSTVAVLNTDAELSAKRLETTTADVTVTGLKTFDRDPSAPFAVTASSSKVTNLDADKIDGFDLDQAVSTTSSPTHVAMTLTGALTAAGLVLPTGSTNLTCDGLTIDENVSIGTTAVLRLLTAGSGAGIIGGFAGGVDGRVLILINTTGQQVTLAEEAAGSTAANRIASVVATAMIFQATSFTILIYNGTTSRWNLLTGTV